MLLEKLTKSGGITSTPTTSPSTDLGRLTTASRVRFTTTITKGTSEVVAGISEPCDALSVKLDPELLVKVDDGGAAFSVVELVVVAETLGTKSLKVAELLMERL